MNFINKLTAFLIIASFIFSSEAFARKRAAERRMDRDEKASHRTIARTKRTPLVRERKQAVGLNKRVVAPRALKRSADQPRVLRSQGRVSQRQTQTPVASVRPTKAVRQVRQPVQRTEQNLGRQARKAPIRERSNYVIQTSDLPGDLKNAVKLVALKKGESLKASYRVTPAELREILSEMQGIESHAPGITQRARQHLTANGYNPANDQSNVSINTAALPEDLKYYVEIFVLDEEETLAPSYSLSSSKATKMLEKMQQRENAVVNAQGVTQRTREFLKEKYGFQG